MPDDDRAAPSADLPAYDADYRIAFLFESRNGELLGVSLDETGANLPVEGRDRWSLKTRFRLGVHEALPASIDPEPILRGLKARGYFVWPAQRTQPFGTAQ